MLVAMAALVIGLLILDLDHFKLVNAHDGTELVQVADRALYAAKRQGRDQVVSAPAPPASGVAA